jgi:hypothetical protein
MSFAIRRARGGFALPVVILAMFLLVGALASGFAMIRGETAADDAVLQQQSAQALAETGLQQGYQNRAGLGLGALPTTFDSARLTLDGGYVDVVTTRLRAPVGTTVPGLYYIRSRGVRTRSGSAGAGNAVAFATGFATFSTINLTVQSSLTSANGINKSGASGEISGVDNCSVANGGGQPTLPAVAVPTAPGYTGSQTPLVGNPKISTIGANETQAAASIPIDWNGIVYNNAVSADFYVEADGTGWPTQAWFDADTTRFPTILVRNGPDPETMFVVDGFGRGTLIVFGSVWFKGNTGGWDGIVIAGGRLRSSGGNQVRGATITGLNIKLGFNVGENEVTELSGTKKFLYNSCYVAKSLQNFSSGGLRAYENSWANSFPAY